MSALGHIICLIAKPYSPDEVLVALLDVFDMFYYFIPDSEDRIAYLRTMRKEVNLKIEELAIKDIK